MPAMNAVQKALAAAAKQAAPTKDKDRFYYEPANDEERDLCQRVVAAKLANDEADREYKAEVAELRAVIDPWREKECAGGTHHGTVDIPLGGYTVQIQYKQYSPFAGESEDELRKIVGDNYDRFFEPTSKLEVAKEVAENPAKLEALVTKLLSVMSADEFAATFEYTQKVKPRDTFDADRYKMLTPAQQAQLVTLGLKQTVAPVIRAAAEKAAKAASGKGKKAA